ncbi:nitroreductase family deazaflavin-dependent oxidoreductase [Actinacidiphila acidipaludis]|uniref:Nitroreductase family deazaflavin-dependent oxidoreductase n=1 Tax=Actinacidiphila acidipaludis TaxID=2873382 RepID=A0ABS7QDY3_9ACTN|nr:nitroreductase family deazaflavin-dependent oxidoreductase [Streptomyces acidipaludis]MBY8880894.1 nitroreductase family deazaflavin-dependent oxidoreductase [Streptomyces acidipaludis]
MPLQGEYQPSPTDYVRLQVELYEMTDGAIGNTFKDRPVIILTTKAAKSGKLRKNPLMRVEHNGRYAIVASNGGGAKDPVWHRNVMANPTVEIQDGPIKHDMRAREVFGEEKNEWWVRADTAYPEFADYRKVAGREIPVYVLEPVEIADQKF